MSDNYLEMLLKELQKNGVSLRKLPFNPDKFTVDELEIEAIGTELFNFLNFSEHDKVFEDKIAKLEKAVVNYKQAFEDKCKDYDSTSELLNKFGEENESLKQRIAELESKETSELPFDPLECANYIINATYERETNGIERTFHNLPEKVNSDRYTIDDLEQIAEHLLIYCKHNKECEE